MGCDVREVREVREVPDVGCTVEFKGVIEELLEEGPMGVSFLIGTPSPLGVSSEVPSIIAAERTRGFVL